MLKELTILSYLYFPMLYVSAPAAGLYFILTDETSSLHRSWWTEVLTIH